jgi:hypothetical protein
MTRKCLLDRPRVLPALINGFLTKFIRPEPVLALACTGCQRVCLRLIPVFAALWCHDAQTALYSG